MAEYIDRALVDKAIEIVGKIFSNDFGAVEAIQQIKVRLHNTPSADVQPIDRWISVEDRLPEERKCVLVCDGKWTWISWIYKGEWHGGFCTVTHWQPLPYPPKEG